MDVKLDCYQAQFLEEESTPHSIRFFLSSAALHLSLLVSSLLINELIPKPESKDLVEISVQELAQMPTQSTAPAAPNQGLVQAPALDEAKVDVKTVKKAAVVSHRKEIAESKDAIQPLPQTQPQSESSSQPVEEVGMKESDFDEDLDRVDQEHASEISKLKNEIDESSEKLLAEKDVDLKALKDDSKKQSEALAKHLAQMKNENEAKIRSALAAEKTAQRLAAEKAAAEATTARNAAAARAAAERAQAETLAKEMAYGNSLGVDVPVRSLQDIKQMPGNARPLYDSEDRLASRQGEVAFLAYVELDGRVSKFKLLKSTGHRELDAKTYAAVRNWKFYPGQEGWVEIPFKWDLRGGVQEKTTTLRRSVTQK